jgi:transcription termination/antitermination protein NusA
MPTSTHPATEAIRALAASRGLNEDELWQAVADALRAAYLRLPGAAHDVDVAIDTGTFTIQVLSYDSDPDGVDVTPDGFGRIAAATFKSALDAAVADATRRRALTRFAGREGTLVEGTVKHVTDRRAVIEVDGVDAVLYRSAMLPGDRLRRGAQVLALLVALRESGDDALTLSRTDDRFLWALVAQHPDVAGGSTEVVAVVREPGRRAKVVLGASRFRDPVASFIGGGGNKIRPLQEALGTERLDVTVYDEDAVRYACDLLGVDVRTTLVEVDGSSLLVRTDDPAVARRLRGPVGANVRLAEQLSGLTITVVGPSAEDAAAN